MRVIAGKAKGRRLEAPSGMDTRPTADRVKETLFNILQGRVPESRFLDLFSGSGGIAIEAVSRGAAEAALVESSKKAVECIRRNVEKAGVADSVRVMRMDVMRALRELDAQGAPFDIIFMDPPYGRGLERGAVGFLLDSSIVKDGSTIVVEASIKTDISYMYDLPCEVERVKEYSSNRHVFLRV